MTTDRAKAMESFEVGLAVKESDVGDIEVVPLNSEWETNDGYKYFEQFKDALGESEAAEHTNMNDMLNELNDQLSGKPTYDIVTDPDA